MWAFAAAQLACAICTTSSNSLLEIRTYIHEKPKIENMRSHQKLVFHEPLARVYILASDRPC